MASYDFSKWHVACPVEVIAGERPQVYCPTHRVTGYISEIAVKISPADSYELDPAKRTQIDQVSQGVEAHL